MSCCVMLCYDSLDYSMISLSLYIYIYPAVCVVCGTSMLERHDALAQR